MSNGFNPSAPRGLSSGPVMGGTTMQTFTVPGIAAVSPATIVKAAQVPLRVLVRNIGGILVFLATSDTALSTTAGPSPTSYQLPPGQADVFVLGPTQSLYALMGGPVTGTICVSISEALPREAF